MKKALLCDTTPLQFPPWQGGKEGGYDLVAQSRSALTVSLPSGEYRSEQSRHVRFFQRLCLDFYATPGLINDIALCLLKTRTF